MKYSFTLHFGDLDREVQEQKIDEVIEYDYDNGNIKKLDEEEKFSIEDALADKEIRSETRAFITSHFPIYF